MTLPYPVKFVLAFLAGAAPVFLVEWNPTSIHTYMDVVVAGFAALGTYHVKSPISN